jgi:hypothetical protein
MKIIRVIAGPVALLITVLLLAACGGTSGGGAGASALTLGKEFPAIKAAAQSATSVRMSGSVVQNGKPISINMALVKPGSAAGSVSEGGTSYTIVVTPAQSYIQLSKKFLQLGHLPTSLCAKVCGKYLAISGSAASSFSGLSMTSLIGTIFSSPLTKAEAAIKLAVGSYQGQPVWTGSGEDVTFYVAKTGTPYLLSVTKHGQSVSFSDWNTATVSTPPASQVVTEAQLGALAAGG